MYVCMYLRMHVHRIRGVWLSVRIGPEMSVLNWLLMDVIPETIQIVH